jgi:regulator of extracellular matrix RemA (YlzA/DUF370 family)
MKICVNIGFGNIVNKERVIAILSPDSTPIKKLKDEFKNTGKIVDATKGKKTRAILITDSGHIIMSAIAPQTLAERINEI